MLHGSIRKRGFSILELIIVVLLLGILAAVAIPKVSKSLAAYQAKVAASRLAADLRYLQSSARVNQTPVTVVFRIANSTGAGKYASNGIANANPYREEVTVEFGHWPYIAKLSSVQGEIELDQNGNFSADSMITLNNGLPNQRSVLVSAATGKVTVQ